MKKYLYGLFRLRIVITLFLLNVINYISTAQNNTSYNLNSIPITGSSNCAFGINSLLSNTSGSGNMAMGYNSLTSNTTGGNNVGIGNGALSTNIGGSFNVAIGNNALTSISNSSYNVAIGTGTLGAYTGTGTGGNVSIGWASSLGATSGAGNVAIGMFSLFSNITGSGNTAIGISANVGLPNLVNATAIGGGAIVYNSNSIQLGNSSVTSVYAGVGTNATLITGGLQVVGGSPGIGKVLTSDAFGNATWQTPSGGNSHWQLTGNSGTVDGINFIGTTDNIPFNIRVNNQKSGRLDPYSQNTFYGILSGNANYNTDGYNNTAVGYNSFVTNTSGYDNATIGVSSMQYNTSGYRNAALGANALNQNTTGDANSAFGSEALFDNNTGRGNTAVGRASLNRNTTGEFNTGIGANALSGNTTGIANTSIGLEALTANITGSFNSAFGYQTTTTATNFFNATALGANTLVTSSNKVRVGDINVTVIEGQVDWSWPSDGRFKFNISENDVKGLDFINSLRPVAYNFDTKRFQDFLIQDFPDSVKAHFIEGRDFDASTSIRHSGFIAQEVEVSAIKLGYDFDGLHIPVNKNDNYSLSYAQFVVPLVKSVQELSRQNSILKKEIEEQKKGQEAVKNEMVELRTMLASVMAEQEQGSLKLIRSNHTAKLFQNAPNPFDKSTVIKYNLPGDAKKAVLTISSANGIKLKEFDLKNKDGQMIEISAGELAAGSYIYSLIIDGVVIDSKTMVLTH